ncbi:DEAD/DEAH box helicase [Arthrobacter woluwensis]|uniref:Superfamily II DNA and RNA helicase n=1 Tax=Arthrobacter woluwensis TaxID=156980 RepID=A0A1H4KVR6_9MICC|nr:DEAD/DEAH box helicase [Arthrobacter woluwensis]PSS43078.1 ATP-dependent helicase [Arthrobacter woluwensis]SEB62178.1 Superfamily II DNA and RNA helicase [Arthrobacter woluwensis]
MTSFSSLGVPAGITSALATLDITEPFPIQVKTLPDTLAGRDVLGRGQTGSGKTLAFAIPLVTRLAGDADDDGARRRASGSRKPRGLVLAPTRELATQIDRTVAPLAEALGLRTTVIFGGVSQTRQEKALAAGVDIVIACPGRLEDLMKQGIVSLDQVSISVLDEADHMADLGFLPVVRRILDATPAGGQRLLFSATLDNGVDKLVNRYMQKPVTHSVDAPQAAVTTMEHHVFLAKDKDAKKLLINDLASGAGKRVLFTRTKHAAKKLAKVLTANGIPAVDLHGNLSQNARDRNLAEFSSGEVRVLVATDVAARGVHVDEVELVIHVDPPAEHKAYLHRSGRTARAGAEGTVVTLVLPEERSEVQKLLRAAGVKAPFTPVAPGSAEILDFVGEQAEAVDPASRAAVVAAKAPQQGGGKSTGANAQRKRARRGGQGGSAAAGSTGSRNERPAQARPEHGAPRGERAPRAERAPRGERPARGERSSAPRTGQRSAAPRGGSATVWSSNTGGTSGGSFGSGGQKSGAGRPPRKGPRRASAPASNERRGR